MRKVAVLTVAMLALVPAGAQAVSTTFTVNVAGDHAPNACDAECTLRDAISAANASAGADTINIPAGTITLSQANVPAGTGEDANASGDLDITESVTISGPNTAQPGATVDGAYIDRVFDVRAGAVSVTISHLAVIRGQRQADAVLTAGASGLVQRGGTVNLNHDIFDGNINSVAGGALAIVGGTMNITDTEVRNNGASRAGGLFIAAGTTAVIDRTLWLNNDGSTMGGGAIYNDGGTLTATNSTFAGNTVNAGRGGAIRVNTGSTTLRNVTFEQNMASGSNGGGSALWAEVPTTISNVLFGNSAYQSNCGPATIPGTTSIAPTDQGGSMDTGTSCGLASGSSNKSVLLSPIALNGGVARSLLPWSNSSSINAGDNVSCTVADQRGTTRLRTVGDPCDVGALEGASPDPAPQPGLTLGAPHDATDTTVQLDATIDRGGLPTTWEVAYGTTTGYGFFGFLQAVGFGGGTGGGQLITDQLGGLTPGTTYHYHFVVTSAGGTTNGADQTFTTLGPPQVMTSAASAITQTGATLNGSVNSSGDATTYHFQYGTSTAYGSVTPGASAGSGFASQAVTADLTGLAPGTTYHYRLVAGNTYSAAVNGADKTFTTASPPGPGLTPPPATAGEPPPAAGPAGAIALKLTLGTLPKLSLRALRFKGVTILVRANRAAQATATLLLRGKPVGKVGPVSLKDGATPVVLRLSKAGKKALTRAKSANLTLVVTSADAPSIKQVLQFG